MVITAPLRAGREREKMRSTINDEERKSGDNKGRIGKRMRDVKVKGLQRCGSEVIATPRNFLG
jgi:hypothetical protein